MVDCGSGVFGRIIGLDRPERRAIHFITRPPIPLGDEAESKAHLDREPWRPGPPHTGPGTQTNEVITSQYTAFNFLFLNLWKQFKRPANVYFLGICILQCIRAVSITNGIPTTLLPLLFVLAVTALKDAIEDFNRHRAGSFFRSGQAAHATLFFLMDGVCFTPQLPPPFDSPPQTTSRTTA